MKGSEDRPGQCINCGKLTQVRTDGKCNECRDKPKKEIEIKAGTVLALLWGLNI